MDLFENLQLMNEVNSNNKTLDEIAEEIENIFYDKFKAKFGMDNDLHANMLFNATKDISNEYFFEGYDIKLTITQSPSISNEFKEFINTFANEFGYDTKFISPQHVDVLIKVDESVQESVIMETQSSESQEIKFVLTARNMWNKDISQRTSFIDEIYDSFEEAQDKCREFQSSLASHMRAGIEKVKFDSNSNLIKLGSYWELFKGNFEKKIDDN